MHTEAMEVRLEMAERLSEARSRLENYGTHHGWCDMLTDPSMPCNCGYVAALNATFPKEGLLNVPRRDTHNCADCGKPLVSKTNVVLEHPDDYLYCRRCWTQREGQEGSEVAHASRE